MRRQHKLPKPYTQTQDPEVRASHPAPSSLRGLSAGLRILGCCRHDLSCILWQDCTSFWRHLLLVNTLQQDGCATFLACQTPCPKPKPSGVELQTSAFKRLE